MDFTQSQLCSICLHLQYDHDTVVSLVPWALILNTCQNIMSAVDLVIGWSVLKNIFSLYFTASLKSTQILPHFCFMFFYCPWAWSLLWHMVDITIVTQLKKTDSPCPRNYQFWRVPCLMVGYCAYFPSSILCFLLLEPVLILWDLTQFICASAVLYLENTLSLKLPTTSVSYCLSSFSSR